MFYKKKLLALPELGITGDMERAARNDDGTPEDVHNWWNDHTWQRMLFKYHGYCRADIHDDILRIAIWSKAGIIGGDKPELILYFDKDNNYITYIVYEDRWSSASFEYLCQWNKLTGPIYSGAWRAEGNFIQDEGNRLIGRFVGEVVGNYKGIGEIYLRHGSRSSLGIRKDVRDLIAAFQSKKLDEKRYCRHKRETDEIDAVMNQVDDTIPSDINNWLIKKGITRQYGFMKPREKNRNYRNTLCSACGKWIKISKNKAKVKEFYDCPKCGELLLLKDWNRQQSVSSSDRIFIIQRMKDLDGYVIRSFNAYVTWSKNKNYKGEVKTFKEFRRKPFGGTDGSLYEWRMHKNGTMRWCYAFYKLFTYVTPDIGSGIVYPGNLQEVFADEPWSRLNLEKIFCDLHINEDYNSYTVKGLTRYVWVEPVVRRLIIHSSIEYMQKAGLDRLVNETVYGHKAREIINSEAKRLKDYLLIDGNAMARLKKLNGGYHMVHALQHACRTGEKVSDETLNYISDNYVSIYEDLLIDRTRLTLNKAVNYRKRQMEKNEWKITDFRTTYNDYISMAEARGMDITDDIVRLNPNMKEYHDRYVEEDNARKASEEDAAADKNNKRIKRDFKKNSIHFGYEWKKEGLAIVVPRKASDIKHEGRVLHHCVGARGYIERMNERKTFIVFLRRKSEIDKPYYTIEVSYDGKIKQFYSAYDRQPDKKKIEKLLSKWSKEVKRREEAEFQSLENKANMKDIEKEQRLLATA